MIRNTFLFFNANFLLLVTAGNILLGQYAEMQDPGTNLLLNLILELLLLLLSLLLLVFPGCWAVC